MKRTISAEVGKGSVNHNSRKFRAENVDGSRTHLNIDYCNKRIQTVYHQLFDEALKRYNEKQARADRRISNYYEKIRSGNQEKPFHEIILQIGNKEDMFGTPFGIEKTPHSLVQVLYHTCLTNGVQFKISVCFIPILKTIQQAEALAPG